METKVYLKNMSFDEYGIGTATYSLSWKQGLDWAEGAITLALNAGLATDLQKLYRLHEVVESWAEDIGGTFSKAYQGQIGKSTKMSETS